jgi:ferric-dicitrate binding protein FerR (iron transport regulator)
MNNDETKTHDAGGMVERLLHAAGPGPEIPENGAARVKEAIRPAWRDGVAARSRQRSRLWVAGIAAAAALILTMIYLPSLQTGVPEPPPRAIVMAKVNGTLEVTPPGATVSFLTTEDTNAEIPRGSLIRTGSESRAALWLADHRSLRLDANTALRLDSEASVSLDSGAVYIDAQNGSDTGIEVRTALGTAADIGTQFEVRLEEGTLDVKVREGLVALTRGSEKFQIAQGVTLSVDTDGEVVTGSVTAYDPAWSWTQEIAPVFDIEGQTVLAFLDWVSSETGLSVRFESAETERLAATTILHGSIEGLTPVQSPTVVLPSARLDISEETGTLLVKPQRETGPGSD